MYHCGFEDVMLPRPGSDRTPPKTWAKKAMARVPRFVVGILAMKLSSSTLFKARP